MVPCKREGGTGADLGEGRGVWGQPPPEKVLILRSMEVSRISSILRSSQIVIMSQY